MIRKNKQFLASLACFGLLVLSACGRGHSSDYFVDDMNEDETSIAAPMGDPVECTPDDMSQCPIGSVCISGVCIDTSAGGGDECDYTLRCPNAGEICSHGVCI